MATDELESIRQQRDATRQRLRIIDQQVAQFGERWAPPHLITDRAEAREALAKYETVLGSAIPPGVGDDLGAGGRFVLTLEEFKTVKDGLALLGYQFGGFVDEMREFVARTEVYRERHATEHLRDRRWGIVIGIIILVLAAFIAGKVL